MTLRYNFDRSKSVCPNPVDKSTNTTSDMSWFQHCLDSLYQWSLVWQLSISCLNCCTIDMGKSALASDECRCSLGIEFLGEPECVSDLESLQSRICASVNILPTLRARHTSVLI